MPITVTITMTTITMTDRTRRPTTGNAAKLLATGASVAAGLGLIGLIEADAGAASVGPVALEGTLPQVTIIRQVIVPTTAPDILLQASMSGSEIVTQEVPAPIVRVRPQEVPAPIVRVRPQESSAPAQSTSSGS